MKLRILISLILPAALGLGGCHGAHEYDLHRGPFLTLVSATPEAVTVAFDGAFPDARRLVMERRRRGRRKYREYELAPGATEYVDRGGEGADALLPGETYFYRLRAHYPHGRTARSVILKVAVPEAPALRALSPGGTAFPLDGRLSPDGTRLAFVENGRVLLWRPATGEIRPAGGEEAGPAVEAVWVPDGSALVVSAGDPGREDLFLLDLSTGEAAPLTRDHAGDRAPEVSPDGSTVTFTRAGRIHLLHLSDGSVTRPGR